MLEVTFLPRKSRRYTRKKSSPRSMQVTCYLKSKISKRCAQSFNHKMMEIRVGGLIVTQLNPPFGEGRLPITLIWDKGVAVHLQLVNFSGRSQVGWELTLIRHNRISSWDSNFQICIKMAEVTWLTLLESIMWGRYLLKINQFMRTSLEQLLRKTIFLMKEVDYYPIDYLKIRTSFWMALHLLKKRVVLANHKFLSSKMPVG